MGLFDFITGAGKKVEEEPEPPTRGQATVDPAELRRLQEKRRAKALEKAVESQGLSASGMDIQRVGERVVVRGKVGTQADREKLILALGNLQGVAQVEEAIEVEKVEPEATFYTVQKGDTLGKIAKTHYGNAGKYPVIFEANRPMLADPDKIYPGQVLRIPPLAG